MKIHWHIRAEPDLHWISPIVCFLSEENFSVTISFERKEFMPIALNFLDLYLPVKPRVIGFSCINEIKADVFVFEWGVGSYSWLRTIYRSILRKDSASIIREQLIRRATLLGALTFAFPHGANVKYGLNNKVEKGLRKIIPQGLLYRCTDRNVFTKYFLDSNFHLERYAYFGVDKEKLEVLPLLHLFKENLWRYPIDDSVIGSILFILPKINNKIKFNELGRILTVMALKGNVIFVLHPRQRLEQRAYIHENHPELISQVKDFGCNFINAIRAANEVHDVGSSVSLYCLSLEVPYYQHSYLSDNVSFFDDYNYPLKIDSPAALNELPKDALEKYKVFSKFMYSHFITKGMSYIEAKYHFKRSISRNNGQC